MLMKSTLTKPQAKSNRRKTPRKKSILGKTRSRAKAMGSGGSVTGGHIPHGKRKKAEAKSKIHLPVITPWKVILTSFLAGICGLIYITHVFSTQQILNDVQQLETEYNQVLRVHAERRLAYDRMVGPKEIYQRAREQGFVNAGPADQIITLN